jgi:hypothetical protein
MALFRKHERIGRPIGDDAIIECLQRLLNQLFKPKKPGPKAIDKQGVPGNPPIAEGAFSDVVGKSWIPISLPLAPRFPGAR